MQWWLIMAVAYSRRLIISLNSFIMRVQLENLNEKTVG